MNRRGLVLALITALFLGESLYFARQGLAGFQRLRGERAFYSNRLAAAWRAYQRALDLGGPQDLLESDRMEVLLFGIGQREMFAKSDLPLDDEAALAEARRLTARAIRRVPYRGAPWSLASDIFLRQARVNRRRMPLDLAAVSEDPLENLTREDWWGIAALEKAAALEPGNYVYDDLLAEQFLSYGAVEQAALSCRRAVTSYPRLEGHPYLTRADLPARVVDAAVEGFQEALVGESLVVKASMEIDAGRLLVRHGQQARAIPFLERAVRASPDLYDAHMELAIALFGVNRFREAIPHIERAAARMPDEASTYHFLGITRMEIGDRKHALEDLRKARILGQGAVKFFHAYGSALEADGEWAEAERQFTAAAYQNPADPLAWSALLAFHLRRENRVAAERDCEKLMAIGSVEDWVREQCTALERGGV